MAGNATRLWVDVDERGNIIITRPKRTEFDGRNPNEHGCSDIAGDALKVSRLTAMSGGLAGFSCTLELHGRLFFLNIQSIPTEQVPT
jgi:hypothetical protein